VSGPAVRRRELGATAAAALLGALVVAGNAWARAEASTPLRHMIGWRGWDDLALAVGEVERGEFPVAPYRITDRLRRDGEDFLAFRGQLESAIAADGLTPGQFWRTLRGRWIAGPEWPVARRFDDSGRAVLLGLAFRLLGGTAPFLLPWLAVLAAALATAWMAAEASRAGVAVAGLVYSLGLAASAFVLDVLMVGYAAAGFGVVALIVVSALAVYAVFGRPTARGIAARIGPAALAIAVCAFCRNANLLVLPGFAIAVALATARVERSRPGGRGRRAAMIGAASAAALALAVGAYGALVTWTTARVAETADRHRLVRTMPQAHDVWITLWQGLGDFDRTKGHVYLDKAGEEAVLEAGGHRRLGRRSQALLRRAILSDIRSDPAWFAGILARRAWATVSLAKLWPSRAAGGTSIVPARSVNEGVTDTYYTMIAQADWIAGGPRDWELPGWIVPLPLALLLALAAVPARAPAASAEARKGLVAVAIVAASALGAPVLLTTASGFEAQTFLVVHVLALGLAAEAVRKAVRSLTGRRPAGPR
jgi:hypothetical protein